MRCVKLAEDGAQAKRTKEERLRLRISISKLSKYEAACQKLPKCCGHKVEALSKKSLVWTDFEVDSKRFHRNAAGFCFQAGRRFMRSAQVALTLRSLLHQMVHLVA